MNDTEKLLASIAKIDYPEATVLTYASGCFWVGGEANDGLFASDTHDRVFADALGIDDDSGWTLWLNQPGDETVKTLAALADAALPEWDIVIAGTQKISAQGDGAFVWIGELEDYPHLKNGDRFTRWSRQLWREEAQ
jgi:hypothetical protein